MALRAQIVLACAEAGQPTWRSSLNSGEPGDGRQVAAEVPDRRLNGLFDEDRPGAPRTITDDQVEALIVKTLEEKPVDATHWSTRSMAKVTGMSQTYMSLRRGGVVGRPQRRSSPLRWR